MGSEMCIRDRREMWLPGPGGVSAHAGGDETAGAPTGDRLQEETFEEETAGEGGWETTDESVAAWRRELGIGV